MREVVQTREEGWEGGEGERGEEEGEGGREMEGLVKRVASYFPGKLAVSYPLFLHEKMFLLMLF